MRKSIFLILIIIACIVGVYGLIDQLPEQLSAEEQAQEDATLRIVATNFEFDKDVYTVQAGETWIVELQNKQGIHGIEIEGLDIELKDDQLTQEVTFDQPGEYNIICSVMCGPGHFDMVSKLVVEG